MKSEFKVYQAKNMKLENSDTLVQFRHFDRNNILEFTDKLRIYADSELYVLVVKGELTGIIHQDCISIKQSEIIMIRSGFKDGFKVYRDEMNVEFYTILTPRKKEPININTRFHIIEPLNFENQRELKREWGARFPYKTEGLINKWLFGNQEVPFSTNHMSWVSNVFETENGASLIFSNEYYHSHSKSYEYYICMKGKDTVLINGKLVSVSKGEVLVIPPGVCHRRLQFEYPYDGFVFRVPLTSKNDKIICQSTNVKLNEDHFGEEADILYLDIGDEVIAQDRKTHYEGWTYCEHEGKYGWIPDNYMELQQDNNFIMKNSYSSYELECIKGEIVEILIQESKWYLVKNDKGRVGWIPIEKTN